MTFLTSTIWGGIIFILLGVVFLGLAFIPKKGRGLTGANIKLVLSGVGAIFLGIVIIVKSFE